MTRKRDAIPISSELRVLLLWLSAPAGGRRASQSLNGGGLPHARPRRPVQLDAARRRAGGAHAVHHPLRRLGGLVVVCGVARPPPEGVHRGLRAARVRWRRISLDRDEISWGEGRVAPPLWHLLAPMRQAEHDNGRRRQRCRYARSSAGGGGGGGGGATSVERRGWRRCWRRRRRRRRSPPNRALSSRAPVGDQVHLHERGEGPCCTLERKLLLDGGDELLPERSRALAALRRMRKRACCPSGRRAAPIACTIARGSGRRRRRWQASAARWWRQGLPWSVNWLTRSTLSSGPSLLDAANARRCCPQRLPTADVPTNFPRTRWRHSHCRGLPSSNSSESQIPPSTSTFPNLLDTARPAFARSVSQSRRAEAGARLTIASIAIVHRRDARPRTGGRAVARLTLWRRRVSYSDTRVQASTPDEHDRRGFRREVRRAA